MTLGSFVNNYRQFDWINGKVILVQGYCEPVIASGINNIDVLSRIRERVLKWVHSENVMLIFLES